MPRKTMCIHNWNFLLVFSSVLLFDIRLKKYLKCRGELSGAKENFCSDLNSFSREFHLKFAYRVIHNE